MTKRMIDQVTVTLWGDITEKTIREFMGALAALREDITSRAVACPETPSQDLDDDAYNKEMTAIVVNFLEVELGKRTDLGEYDLVGKAHNNVAAHRRYWAKAQQGDALADGLVWVIILMNSFLRDELEHTKSEAANAMHRMVAPVWYTPQEDEMRR